MGELDDNPLIHPPADSTIRVEGFQPDAIHPAADATIRGGRVIPLPAPPVYRVPDTTIAAPIPHHARPAPATVAPPPDPHAGQVFVDQEEGGIARLQGAGDKDPFTAQLPPGAREGQWIPDPRLPPTVGQAAGAIPAAGQAQATALQAAGTDEQAALQQQAQQQAQAAQQQQALVAQQQADRAEAKKNLSAKRQEYANFKYHDFFADRTGGQKVMIGLGILLGGIGRHPNQVNQALELVQNAINRDTELQRDKHKALFQAVEQAQGDVSQLSHQQLSDLAAFRQQQADHLAAIIKQGDAMAAKSKNAVGVAELGKLNAKLNLEAAQATEEAHRAEAAAVEKRRMDTSTIGLHKSEAAKNYAQAAHARAEAGGAAAKGAEEQVAKLAGHLYPQQATAVKAVRELNEGEAMLNQLKTNPSAITSTVAMDMIGKLASGGRTSIALFKKLGSTTGSMADVTEDKIKQAFTGKSGNEVRKILTEQMRGMVEGKRREVEALRTQHTTALGGLEKRYPDAVKNMREGLFGAPQAATPAPDDNAAAAWAKANPNDPRAKIILGNLGR